jgi:hypothetical protein
MARRMTDEVQLPRWVQFGIGTVGGFLLLPFVMPALFLMILAALTIIVPFTPFLVALGHRSPRGAHRHQGAERSTARGPSGFPEAAFAHA